MTSERRAALALTNPLIILKRSFCSHRRAARPTRDGGFGLSPLWASDEDRGDEIRVRVGDWRLRVVGIAQVHGCRDHTDSRGLVRVCARRKVASVLAAAPGKERLGLGV
jgi:hypothetical protein